jgi:uncharacterized protein with von Willebrand factor type A (vWA) domain
MSIIVKHRTDLDIVAERVGVQLGGLAGATGSQRRADDDGALLRACRRLLELAEELRGEGVAVGTSELLDAFSALGEVSWSERLEFTRGAGADAGQVPEDRRVFDLVFERFFFRARRARGTRARDLRAGRELDAGAPAIDLAQLRERIAQAIREGDDAALARPRARWPSPRSAARARARASSASTCSGSAARWSCARRRAHAEPRTARGERPSCRARPCAASSPPAAASSSATRSSARSAAPSRPLNELDRALPSGPLQDLAAVHRVVAQLKRRLATQGHERAGAAASAGRRAADDARVARDRRRAGRAQVGPRRPRRPEIYVLCDVSTSVTSASVFFLSVLHALHDNFRKMRSFVFIERISEVTEIFERERSLQGGVGGDRARRGRRRRLRLHRLRARVDRVPGLVEDDLHPRSTVIVLGDARTNGRDPRADVFAQVAEKAGRTFWLNPEPRLYWNYGDSVIAAYERHCRAFECWTTGQLEEFVKALTRTGPGD